MHDVPGGQRDWIPIGGGHGDLDVVKHEWPEATSVEEVDVGEDDEEDGGEMGEEDGGEEEEEVKGREGIVILCGED